MENLTQLVVFRVEEQRYALALEDVERVVQAVEVTPLPGAPAIVIGAINVEGRVLPVLNVRRRLRLPERAIGLDDQFLIARSGQRDVVLVIDEAQEVIERPASAVIDLGPGLEHYDGVVELNGGLVLIHDLEKFLSIDEARTLDEAMPADA